MKEHFPKKDHCNQCAVATTRANHSLSSAVRTILVVIAVAFIQTGCAPFEERTNSLNWKERMFEDAQKPQVTYQICAPNAPPVIGLSTINKNGYGGGGTKSAFSTSKGQPVFQSQAGFPGKTQAVTVKLQNGPVQYVYLPPNKIQASGWTAWQNASFETTESEFSYKFLYGIKYESSASTATSPKIRYSMMSYADNRRFLERSRLNPNLESAPSC
jgi:hypothetical protein